MADNQVLLIGLGGTGCRTVKQVVRQMDERRGETDRVAALGIDLEQISERRGFRLFSDFEVEEPRRDIESNLKDDEYFRRWWPTRSKDGDLYYPNRAIASETRGGQIRPNGRLAAVWHHQKIRDRIGTLFEKASTVGPEGSGTRPGFLTFIVCTLGGGTGSGILHEVAYACRAHMGARDALGGLFFGPTVVRAFADPQTGPMSYASLVEIEHWMNRPEDYFDVPLREESGIRSFWEDQVEKGGADYLDFSFLVQRENSNGLLMSGYRTGSTWKDYQQLAANWLFAFLTGDVLNPDEDSRSRIYENTFRRIESGGADRSQGYCGFGTMLLSVPIGKITDFLTASWVARAFAKWQDTEADLQPGDYFSSKLKLRNSDVRATLNAEASDDLHQKLDRVASALRNADDYDAIKRVGREGDLNDCAGGWQDLLDAYETAAKDALLGAGSEPGGRLERALEHVDRAIERRLKKKDGDFPLHPADVSAWVDRLRSLAADRKEWADERASSRADEWKAPAEQEFQQVASANLWQRLFAKDEIKSHVRSALRKIRKEKHRREEELLKEFYERLQEGLERRWRLLDGYQEALENLSDRNRKRSDRYREEEEAGRIIDQEQLRDDEHPLELEVGTDPEYVTEKFHALWGDIDAGRVALGIVEGRSLAEERFSWEGVGERYEEDIEDFTRAEHDDEVFDPQRAANDLVSRIEEYLELEVERDIQTRVNQEFHVAEALDHFLEEKLADARAYDADSPRADVTEDQFRAHFGRDGQRELLGGELPDKKEWKARALGLLVEEFVDFAAPFWSLGEEEKDTAEGHGAGELESVHVYVPEHPSNPRSAIKRAVSLDATDVGYHSFGDPHSLAVIRLQLGYPIYAVRGMEKDRRSYLDHVDRWRRGGASVTPYHVDRRFFEEWADDLASVEPLNKEEQDLSFLLYLLGLGTGVLEVDRSGATTSYRFRPAGGSEETEKLDESVMGVIELLTNDRDERERVRRRIADVVGPTLAAASHDRGDAQEQIWEYFHRGLQEHESVRPPGSLREHLKLWQDIADAGDIEKVGDGRYHADGRLVPAGASEFDRTRDDLAARGG